MSERDYADFRSDTLLDLCKRQRELLEECERALTPFGRFADNLCHPDSDDTGDEPNELWPVPTSDLWAVQTALAKLRKEQADET